MIRKIASALYSSSQTLESQFHIRTDPYQAIHLTPMVQIDNFAFQEYVGELQKTANP